MGEITFLGEISTEISRALRFEFSCILFMTLNFLNFKRRNFTNRMGLILKKNYLPLAAMLGLAPYWRRVLVREYT
jgi:hypothetical protein